jgi:hypothetical protein
MKLLDMTTSLIIVHVLWGDTSFAQDRAMHPVSGDQENMEPL